MINRVIIGVLAFLVILSSSGLYFYSRTLDQQIEALSGQLESMQREQAAQMSQLSDELTIFKGEALANIATLRDETGSMKDEISTLGNVIDGTMSRIGTLEDEIQNVAAEVSQSVINADEVYQKVKKAAVSISDGEGTVGSGFILDTRGHVVTAHHVVDQLAVIYVVLSDGRSSTATVAGSCKFSDVAVLTLDDEQLVVEPPLLADSSTVQIGEPVVAIGNPFDLTETLTSGIVSQINRFVEIKYDSQTRPVANVIQFDAAVNFGNSGGPLVNARGEVIGLVIARVDPERGDGIYYAVSSNKVQQVVSSLIAKGSFDYPWLGVEIANVTPKILQDRGLETINGVLIKRVLPQSPAEAGGLKVDDIIVAIDGFPLKDVAQLASYLGEFKSPEDLVSLTVIRESTKLEVSVELGKQKS